MLEEYEYEDEYVEDYEDIETYSEELTEDWTFEDTCLTVGIGFAAVAIILIVLKAIKRNFKNLNLKVGKFEVNLETKDDK